MSPARGWCFIIGAPPYRRRSLGLQWSSRFFSSLRQLLPLRLPRCNSSLPLPTFFLCIDSWLSSLRCSSYTPKQTAQPEQLFFFWHFPNDKVLRRSHNMKRNSSSEAQRDCKRRRDQVCERVRRNQSAV